MPKIISWIWGVYLRQNRYTDFLIITRHFETVLVAIRLFRYLSKSSYSEVSFAQCAAHTQFAWRRSAHALWRHRTLRCARCRKQTSPNNVDRLFKITSFRVSFDCCHHRFFFASVLLSSSPVDTTFTRQSSRIVSVDASSSATVAPWGGAESVISAILREQPVASSPRFARRKSSDVASSSSRGRAAFDTESLLPMTSSTIGSGAFELPGIHISRIETVEYDEDGGGGGGGGRYVRSLYVRRTRMLLGRNTDGEIVAHGNTHNIHILK